MGAKSRNSKLDNKSGLKLKNVYSDTPAKQKLKSNLKLQHVRFESQFALNDTNDRLEVSGAQNIGTV